MSIIDMIMALPIALLNGLFVAIFLATLYKNNDRGIHICLGIVMVISGIVGVIFDLIESPHLFLFGIEHPIIIGFATGIFGCLMERYYFHPQ